MLSQAGLYKQARLPSIFAVAVASAGPSITGYRWTRRQAKNAMDLVIVANIPGFKGGGGGMADSRRVMLTLDRCRWASPSDPIQIQVSSAGVKALTEPKAKEK